MNRKKTAYISMIVVFILAMPIFLYIGLVSSMTYARVYSQEKAAEYGISFEHPEIQQRNCIRLWAYNSFGTKFCTEYLVPIFIHDSPINIDISDTDIRFQKAVREAINKHQSGKSSKDSTSIIHSDNTLLIDHVIIQ